MSDMEFAEIARDHLDDVYRYLLYLTGDRTVAEDLAGDTLERAFRERQKYDPRRAKPRSWLLAIARSVALDHFRRVQRRRQHECDGAELAPTAFDPADAAGISDDLGAALEDGLRRISAADREVIALRVVLDLEPRQAAYLLGISESACTTRLSRALSRLEQEVRSHACA
jgi:RNA polymerase sigma-70 factor (ECF subfamily)